MRDKKFFNYWLASGLLVVSAIYLLPEVFNNFPGGEEGLMYASPIWFIPMTYGIGGFLALLLKKQNPRRWAALFSAWSLLALAWFFFGVWQYL